MNEPDERLDEVVEERRRFEVTGAVIALVVLATVAAFAFVVLGRSGETTTPLPTEVPSAVAGEPRLLTAVDLRSAPSGQVAIVARLLASEPILVLGRSEDGAWIALGPVSRPAVAGWVPVEQVEGIDVSQLPVLSDPRGGSTGVVPTLTPDLPDLHVEAAYARENRLRVSVTNQGAGDAVGRLLVSVNDGPPVPLDIARPGEPLRPGERADGGVPGGTVQIRSAIKVRVFLDPPTEEEDPDNNTWDGIVEPDAPNDIEILSVAAESATSGLVVTLRNNSPIPVTGTFTVSIREALPSTNLLERQIITGTIEAGVTARVEFPTLIGVDVNEIAIRLSSDGVDDASIANNVYPR